MKRNENLKEISLVELKSLVREKIIEKYGSVRAFLESPLAQKLGGTKVRCYLYDSGAMSFEVFQELCKELKIGKLKKRLKVTRSVRYFL